MGLRITKSSSGATRGWRKRLDLTFAVVDALRTSASPDDVCQCLLTYTARYGVSHVLAGVMPEPGASRLEQMSHVLLSAWPDEWSSRYFSRGYLYEDPTITRVRDGSAPFRWRDLGPPQLGRGALRVMSEATAFGLRDGLTLSYKTLEDKLIGLSFAGDRLEMEPGHYDVFRLIGACALGQAVSIGERAKHENAVSLSRRQRDVLLWSAEGFNKDQVAEQLGISRHTVDSHLRAIRERLGVASTIHAVAKAYQQKLIH